MSVLAMIAIINEKKPEIEIEGLNGFSFGHRCIERYNELHKDVSRKDVCMIYAKAIEQYKEKE